MMDEKTFILLFIIILIMFTIIILLVRRVFKLSGEIDYLYKRLEIKKPSRDLYL